MKCQNCGFEMAPGATFCNACGQQQPVQKKCTYCGTICPPNAGFCPNCGRTLPAASQPPMPMTAIPTAKKEKPKKGASFFIAIILAVFSIGTMAGMIFFGFIINEAKNEIIWYQNENDSLRNKLSDAQYEFKEVKDFMDADLLIKITDVYNSDGNENPINSMYASQMRYLHVDYEILWLDSSPDSTLYIDIYGPDGTLQKNNATSPYGHTMTVLASEGSHGTGWGNSTTSTYEAGEYLINFVYENEIICSQNIRIR